MNEHLFINMDENNYPSPYNFLNKTYIDFMTDNKQSLDEAAETDLHKFKEWWNCINPTAINPVVVFNHIEKYFKPQWQSQQKETKPTGLRWVRCNERMPQVLEGVFARDYFTKIVCVDFEYWIKKYPESINTLEWLLEEETKPVDTPQWYKKEDIYDWLIHEKYSKYIATELSEKWAQSNQYAFKKGWEKATNDGKTGTFDYKYFPITKPVEDKENVVGFVNWADKNNWLMRSYKKSYRWLNFGVPVKKQVELTTAQLYNKYKSTQ